jgi:hypothetical protein
MMTITKNASYRHSRCDVLCLYEAFFYVIGLMCGAGDAVKLVIVLGIGHGGFDPDGSRPVGSEF